MRLTKEILFFLTEYQRSYSDIRKKLYGKTKPEFKRGESDISIKSTLCHLKKRGLIEQSNDMWRITSFGKKHLSLAFPIFKKNPVKNTKNKILIIFDVPEEIKRKRDWLRRSLIELGFTMIQKSVWLGPAPLPKDFVKALSDLRLISFLKFLEVKEVDLI